MNDPSLLPLATRRLAITMHGVVQGVGFRPFVYNAARGRGLAGWVLNEADVVRIEVQGDPAAIDAFLDRLRHAPPPQARIDAIEVQEISPLPLGEGSGVRASSVARQLAGQVGNLSHNSPHPSPLPKGEGTVSFEIRTSTAVSAPRPTIPADLATCRECLAEIRDPSQRRHNYPFTNCTNCGPRWSIIEQLPYDRPRTSMAGFTMCPACQAEYDDPADRRFHAQPIACPRCGPTLQLLDPEGRETAAGQAALDATARLLIAGRIVAIKGLGGFQLLVDAANAEAVARLRQRKHRPDRPFAIMLASLDDVRRHCDVSEEEARLLSSHQAPIVLLRRRVPSPLSFLPSPFSPVASVAPGNPYLGVMLPYTPLHHLLLAAVARPLVCTSGNLAEEPMAIAVEDALRRLGPIADAILTHNRPIVRPVDDSIVRVGPDGPQVLRRARGFAPLPIGLQVDAGDVPTVLAVGGHLKNTVALALGGMHETRHDPAGVGAAVALPPLERQCNYRSNQSVRANTPPTQVVMSSHVGDLDNVLSVDVFRRAIDDLLGFFQAAPDVVVCDLHPDYASTQHAQDLSARWDVPLVRVQHHHAHVAACMAEYGLQGPVLGFSWDGAGYGPDGTAWGGEVLLCEGPEFQRAAYLRTFALPGGDRAAREPRRSALGLLFDMLGEQATEYAADWFDAKELDSLLAMLRHGIRCPRTSSMGRLFDAVAALCGRSPVISFEGQAAMALEYAADENEQESYTFTLSHPPNDSNHSQELTAPGRDAATIESTTVIDWAPMIHNVLTDRAAGVPVARISARFHNGLANMAVAVARCVAPTRQLPIVLTGGCFQNALLTARLRNRLSSAGFQVYTHKEVPPGDGGIALGQAFLALEQLCRR